MLQVVERGLAIITSHATGVSVGWLLNNDLAAPMLTRYGEPFETKHFAAAQMLKTRGAYPDARFGLSDYYEAMLAGFGRLYGVFVYLADARPELMAVAEARLQRFVRQLEQDFGTVPSDEGEGLDEQVSSGLVASRIVYECVRAPGWKESLGRLRTARLDLEALAVERTEEENSVDHRSA